MVMHVGVQEIDAVELVGLQSSWIVQTGFLVEKVLVVMLVE